MLVIKNSNKLMGNEINGWLCYSVTTTADMDNIVEYEFQFMKSTPVKSSPYQQFYHMSKDSYYKIKVRILTNEITEFNNEGCVEYMPTYSFKTLNGFVELLENRLPIGD